MLNIIAVLASDWGVTCAQVAQDSDWRLVTGWVVGILIHENDDMLVIAHHQFSDGDVRHTTAVPKANIIERVDKELKPDGDS